MPSSNSRAFTRLAVLPMCFLALTISSGLAYAKVINVTLEDLVKKSDVIVYGHLNRVAIGKSLSSPPAVNFDAQLVLKGRSIASVGVVSLCNIRTESSDRDDLSHLGGDFILFLSKKGQCLDLSHGYRSVIDVEQGNAVTGTIEDQAENQPLRAFLAKVENIADDSGSRARDKLAELAKDFASARALPDGSRPGPPEFDLNVLLGLRSSRIRSALGSRDNPVAGYRYDCGAKLCWTFTYGPTNHVTMKEIREVNGLETIEVTAGGPFLLVLGISSNRVITAKWLGQK